jgi:3-isopropylmalate/(R)-2-methylmalate dehydratase small subunit
LLPVVLSEAAVDELFRRVGVRPGYELTVDLNARSVSDQAGFHSGFEIEDYRRAMLMNGLDEIGRTLLEEPRIAAFERRRLALSVAKAQ